MPSVKLSVNENAYKTVKMLMKNAEELGLSLSSLSDGTTIIDAGVNTPSGIRAGMLIAKVALGGLAEVSVVPVSYENITLPTVHVTTDYPAISLLTCQQPLPTIEVGEYSAIVSGPGKALMGRPEEFFKISRYSDEAKKGIFIMQSGTIPNEKVSSHIARECKIDPENLFLIVAPTCSIAGAVQVSARMMENPLWRLARLGFDALS